MKPKPLDLEEIWDLIYNVFLEHYEERVCDVSNVDLRIFVCPKCGNTELLPKMCHCDYLFEKLKEKKKEIKQRIKQACEFYLRYKDKPELLVKEHPEFGEEIEKLKWLPNPDFEACKEEWFKKAYGNNIGCDNCPVRNDCLEGEFIENINFDRDYNEWLFKLTFKSAFEDKEVRP